MDIKAFFIKLIKKTAIERNEFFTFEKKGDFFIHTYLTKELANRLEIPVNQFVRKNLFELHTEEVALSRRELYKNAWGGQETVYRTECAFNSKCPVYVVLTPVFLGGKVVSVIGHGVPAMYVPIQFENVI